MASTMSPMTVMGHVENDTIGDLTRFIEDQARRLCVRIVLAQRVGDALHTVNEWLIAEMLDAGTLARALHDTGLREAHTLRESVAYGVFAFRSDCSVPAGRFFFRIEAGTDFRGRADTPDERGLIGMLMQHTESSARLALGHSREIVDQYQTLLGQGTGHLTRLLEQAYARIRVLESRETEAIDLRDKLQSAAAERTGQLEALKRKDEMRKFAMEKLGPIVPMIMGKLLGSGVVPGDGAPTETAARGASTVADVSVDANGNLSEQIVDRLIGSMSPDQLGSIARLLEPEQLALFAQLYELAEARIMRAQKAASNPNAAAAATPPTGATPPTAATSISPAPTKE